MHEIRNERVGKCACCIATYNGHDTIKAVLSQVMELYQQYGVDIYVYDSSESRETEEIVEEIVNSGYLNLYYIRLKAGITFGEKILTIFSGYGLKRQYKYIWPIKNRSYVNEEMLKKIVSACEEEYDALFIGPEEVKESKEYTDAGLFYNDWGARATSLSVTLYNYASMLTNFDPKKFINKYYFDGRNDFEHYAVLFDELGKKEVIRVKVIGGGLNDIPGSLSLWTKEVFKIWADLWIKVSMALPDCYNDYKEIVIRRCTSWPWILGSNDQLIYYQQMGVLNPKVYENVKDIWSRISKVSLKELELIANGKFEELAELVVDSLINYLKSGKRNEAEALFQRNKMMMDTFFGIHSFSQLAEKF